MFSVTFREPWVIQNFLPAVKHGDKRIILVDGEFAGAVNRVPAADDLRSNMVRGGAAEATDLTAARARDLRNARAGAARARADVRRHRRDRRLSHRDQRHLADRHPRHRKPRRPRRRGDDLGQDRGQKGLVAGALRRCYKHDSGRGVFSDQAACQFGLAQRTFDPDGNSIAIVRDVETDEPRRKPGLGTARARLRRCGGAVARARRDPACSRPRSRPAASTPTSWPGCRRRIGRWHDLTIANGWPEEWFEIYTRENFSAVDPVPRHGASTVQPFEWSEAVYDTRARAARPCGDDLGDRVQAASGILQSHCITTTAAP